MDAQPAPIEIREFQKYASVAKGLAERADALLLQGWGMGTASQKADGSLVTETDHIVDRFLTSEISAAYPNHAILSEECNTTYDPAVEYTWVIDPLDGTTNFTRGLPVWGVSIALLWQGTPVVGVLRFVLLRESYSAVYKCGATLNGAKIATSTLPRADDQHFLMTCTRTPRTYRVVSPLKPRILGSAAYHIAAVANGSALAAIEATPKLWDIAASLLILTEAGGVYRRLASDAPIYPLGPQSTNFERISFPLLAAANLHILHELEFNIAPAS